MGKFLLESIDSLVEKSVKLTKKTYDKQTSDVVCCVVDCSGNYVSQADRLVRDYKRVYYCCLAWQDAFPKINKPFIGKGIKGLEVIDSIWDVYKEIDLFVFPDVFFGDLQKWLVENGKSVWGSRKAESLENNRDFLKVKMKSLGLPVNEWIGIKGIKKLREYLEKNDNVFVKLNKWRGTVETFNSKNYKLIKPVIDEISNRLGMFGEEVDFVVEKPVSDAVEVGYDGWTIDGKYPDICLSGVEIKGLCYAGKVMKYNDISPLITDFNTKMVDVFTEYGYRGFFSTEIRVDKNKTPYMIDFTARTPSPPGEIYLELFDNLGEIIWAGANGEVVIPKTSANFAVEMILESDWAAKNFQPVYFPEKVKRFVKLKKNAVVDGVNYIIPQADVSGDVGAIVGLGSTLDEAVKNCRDVADEIEGIGITERVDSLDNAQEELDRFDKIK